MPMTVGEKPISPARVPRRVELSPLPTISRATPIRSGAAFRSAAFVPVGLVVAMAVTA